MAVLTMAAFPLDSVQIGSRSPAFLMSAVLVVAAFIDLLSRRRKPSALLPLSVWLTATAFLGLSALTGLWSIAPHISAFALTQLVLFLCTSVALAFAGRDDLDSLLWGYVGGAAALAALSVFGVVSRDSIGSLGVERSVTAGNYNDSAVVYALAIVMALYLMRSRARVQLPVLLSLAGVLAIGIVQSGSRTGTLVAIVGVLVAIFIRAKRSRHRITTFALTAVVIALSLAWVIAQVTTPQPTMRILRLFNSGGELDLSKRDEIWALAGQVPVPPLGLGYGTSGSALDYFYADPSAIHNDYIGLYLEFGLFGILIPASFLLATIYWALKNATTRPLMVPLWIMTLSFLFMYPLSLRRGFWVVIALSFLVAAQSKRDCRLDGVSGGATG